MAEVRHRVSLARSGHIAQFCKTPPPNVPLGKLTSRAHVYFDPALMDTAVLPGPRSTEGRFVPISARGVQEQELAHAGPA